MKGKPDLIVRYVLICDDIREEKSGKETLVGVYNEKIIVGSLPALLPKLCFRICVAPVQRSIDVSLSVQAPKDGESITGLKAVIPVKVEKATGHTLNLIMSPFVIKSEGEYSLIIEHGENKETALKFCVEIRKNPVVHQ